MDAQSISNIQRNYDKLQELKLDWVYKKKEEKDKTVTRWVVDSHLSYNNIGDEGAKAIGEALKVLLFKIDFNNI